MIALAVKGPELEPKIGVEGNFDTVSLANYSL